MKTSVHEKSIKKSLVLLKHQPFIMIQHYISEENKENVLK